MGKYTNLAKQLREGDGQKRDISNKYVKINNIKKEKNPPSVESALDGATRLRGYAVNAVVRCIHGTTPDACQVCNGYARWLIADEDRLRRAQARPEEVRREFWRSVKGRDA
jgi:hypothetical protein